MRRPRRTRHAEFKIKLEILWLNVRSLIVEEKVVGGFNSQVSVIDPFIETAADVSKMLDLSMHIPLEEEEAMEQRFCNGHAVKCSPWGAFHVFGLLKKRREFIQDVKKAFDGL